MTELTYNGMTVKAESNIIIISGREFVMPADITMLYHIDNDIYIDCGGKYFIFTGNQFASVDRIPNKAKHNYSAQGVSSTKNKVTTNSTKSRLTRFSQILILVGIAFIVYVVYRIIQLFLIGTMF